MSFSGNIIRLNVMQLGSIKIAGKFGCCYPMNAGLKHFLAS